MSYGITVPDEPNIRIDMFMKLSILAVVFGAFYVNHADLSTSKPIKVEPVAIVKYKDTVYQCQRVAVSNCGYSIDCGNMSVHCIKNITIEYL